MCGRLWICPYVVLFCCYFFFRAVTLWITNHVQFLITSLWYAKLNSLGVLWKGFFFVRQLRIGSISTAYSDLEYPRLPPKWVRFSYMTPNVMWVEVAVAWLSTFSKRNLYWYICFPLSSIYAKIDAENFRESMLCIVWVPCGLGGRDGWHLRLCFTQHQPKTRRNLIATNGAGQFPYRTQWIYNNVQNYSRVQLRVDYLRDF